MRVTVAKFAWALLRSMHTWSWCPRSIAHLIVVSTAHCTRCKITPTEMNSFIDSSPRILLCDMYINTTLILYTFTSFEKKALFIFYMIYHYRLVSYPVGNNRRLLLTSFCYCRTNHKGTRNHPCWRSVFIHARRFVAALKAQYRFIYQSRSPLYVLPPWHQEFGMSVGRKFWNMTWGHL